MSTTPPLSHATPKTTTSSTIDRSAAESAKGPRLQRLRAALFLLDAIADDDNLQAYAAVEALGDASITTANAKTTASYFEEDKNYDSNSTLTFASTATLNSIVIFLDQWIDSRYSTTVRFGFYTTASIGKEKNAGRAKALNLTLPEKPILELLCARDYNAPNLLACVVALVLNEYEEQYQGRARNGHLSAIKCWSTNDWVSFFDLVKWLFSEADESDAYAALLKAIRQCRYYNDKHEGKEELLAATLVDLFDRKQGAADFSQRFVHASEVELRFIKVANGTTLPTDPLWAKWETIPPPSDQRNVSEKFLAVCPALPIKAMERYRRHTADGHLELEAHLQDKNVLAMRYQIYDACADVLDDMTERAATLTAAELKQTIEELTQRAMQRVMERAAEYGYSHKTESFVRGLLLELFDSCFLAFPESDT